jgi:hypothetical protein
MGVWLDDRTAGVLVGILTPTTLAAMQAKGYPVAELHAAAERYKAGAADRPPIRVEWLTVQQVAVALHLTPRTIRRLCDAGTLQAERQLRPGATRASWKISPDSVKSLSLRRTSSSRTVAAEIMINP